MIKKTAIFSVAILLSACASTDTTGGSGVTKMDDTRGVSRVDPGEVKKAANAIPNEGTVTSIIAADEFFVDGKWQVHLAGVDAPIADQAKRQGDYYGRKGFELVTDKALNETVVLKYDKFAKDYMGRLLAYVTLPDGTYLNEYLIKNGHAIVACVPPNTKDCKRFADLQRTAVASGKGIWGAESAPTGANYTAEAKPSRFAVVQSALDGDTIQLEDGTVVRYIGIDSPEEEDQLYQAGTLARAAHERNSKLVVGKEVELEYDVEAIDPRDRDLAYVYVRINGERVMVNEQLVSEGLAWVAVFPPNVARIGELFAAQQRAVSAGSGVWQTDK